MGRADWIGDKDFPDAGDPNAAAVAGADAAESQEVLYPGQRRFHRRLHSKGRRSITASISTTAASGMKPRTTCAWIKLLRKTLDSRGLSPVKIVAAAKTTGNAWNIVDALNRDAALKKAIDVVGSPLLPRGCQCRRRQGVRQATMVERGWAVAQRLDGGRYTGENLQPQLHQRPHDQDDHLEPDEFRLRKPPHTQLWSDQGPYALVRPLRGPACFMGDRPHHTVRTAGLEVP